MNIQNGAKFNNIENTHSTSSEKHTAAAAAAAHGVRNKIKQWKCYWKNIAGGFGCF